MYKVNRKYHFIYKTTNLITKSYYIGMHSTDNLDDGYLGSGRRLRYSINQYGKENHKRKILEFCKSRQELMSKEKEVVNLNEIAKKECMNLMIGGKGGYPYQHNPEGAKRFQKAGNDAFIEKLKSDPKMRQLFVDLGNRLNESGKAGKWTGQEFKGKRHSEETKNKIGRANSITQSGSKNSQYGTMWITNEKQDAKIKKCDPIPEGYRKGRNKKLKK